MRKLFIFLGCFASLSANVKGPSETSIGWVHDVHSTNEIGIIGFGLSKHTTLDYERWYSRL